MRLGPAALVPGVWSALFWGPVNLQGGPTQSLSLPAAFPGGLPGLRRDPPHGLSAHWVEHSRPGSGSPHGLKDRQARLRMEPGPSLTLSHPAPLCVQWFDFFFPFEPSLLHLSQFLPHYQGD